MTFTETSQAIKDTIAVLNKRLVRHDDTLRIIMPDDEVLDLVIHKVGTTLMAVDPRDQNMIEITHLGAN